MTDQSTICPLCKGAEHGVFATDAKRHYLRCSRCQLVFVPVAFHLDAEQEKAVYDLHENSLTDPGYERFLSRMLEPMIARLTPGSPGLDFGCGPAPLLAKRFEEAGFRISIYDPYYQPDDAVLSASYAFITATEVVEHLALPGAVIAQLWEQLLPGGLLGIMTKRVLDRERFSTWHYKNDPTHISFFSDATFAWLAAHLNAQLTMVSSDVVILKKAEA